MLGFSLVFRMGICYLNKSWIYYTSLPGFGGCCAWVAVIFYFFLPIDTRRHITDGVAKQANTSSVLVKWVRWGRDINWPRHWPHMYTWKTGILISILMSNDLRVLERKELMTHYKIRYSQDCGQVLGYPFILIFFFNLGLIWTWKKL